MPSHVDWTIATVNVLLDVADRCGERCALDAMHCFVKDDALDVKFIAFVRGARASSRSVDRPGVDYPLTAMYGELIGTFERACAKRSAACQTADPV